MYHALIAEDNPVFRRALKEMLVRHFPFMDVEEATDGEQALDQGTATHHDLVFLDINMPRHTGLEVSRAIKSGDREAVVCIVTNYDLPEYRQAAEDSGADYFIVKGDSTEAAISGVVESALAGRLKALVVDGDKAGRAALCELLQRQWPQMIVAEAADAAQGLEEAASLKPDLLLIDAGLSPDQLGRLAVLGAAPTSVPIVFLAPADRPEYRAAAALAGAIHCVAKDGDLAAGLRQVIDSLLPAASRQPPATT